MSEMEALQKQVEYLHKLNRLNFSEAEKQIKELTKERDEYRQRYYDIIDEQTAIRKTAKKLRTLLNSLLIYEDDCGRCQ